MAATQLPVGKPADHRGVGIKKLKANHEHLFFLNNNLKGKN
jgi:hypothetical protein